MECHPGVFQRRRIPLLLSVTTLAKIMSVMQLQGAESTTGRGLSEILRSEPEMAQVPYWHPMADDSGQASVLGISIFYHYLHNSRRRRCPTYFHQQLKRTTGHDTGFDS